MSYALIKNNKVSKYPYSLREFSIDHPNVSLPQEPTETQLNEVGLYNVIPMPQPTIDYTKNITEGTPTLVNSIWTQNWVVTDATESQIQTREEETKVKNKEKAMQLLTETDWTQMPDVNLINKDEFTAYRAALRQIAINPQIDITWPTKPSEQW